MCYCGLGATAAWIPQWLSGGEIAGIPILVQFGVFYRIIGLISYRIEISLYSAGSNMVTQTLRIIKCAKVPCRPINHFSSYLSLSVFSLPFSKCFSVIYIWMSLLLLYVPFNLLSNVLFHLLLFVSCAFPSTIVQLILYIYIVRRMGKNKARSICVPLACAQVVPVVFSTLGGCGIPLSVVFTA